MSAAVKHVTLSLAIISTLIPLITGCACFYPDCFFPDVQVARYEVTVPAAEQPEFREVVNKLALDLADELGWQYVPGPIFANGPGSLHGHFNQSLCQFAFIEWESVQGTISIGWRGVRSTSPEFKNLREHFENVLNKKYPSHWKFYYQNKSYILV
jgi:hypothetical protein